MRMPRMVFVSLFAVTLLSFLQVQKHEIPEAGIALEFPGPQWALHERMDTNGSVVYFFKRVLIEDNEGRKVIPNIGVIVEPVPEGIDVVAYSALKRSQKSFRVSEVITPDNGRIGIQDAIAYKGTYADQRGTEHTIYVVHGINQGKGIQIICDVTTSLINKLQPEFEMTLKSIRIR